MAQLGIGPEQLVVYALILLLFGCVAEAQRKGKIKTFTEMYAGRTFWGQFKLSGSLLVSFSVIALTLWFLVTGIYNEHIRGEARTCVTTALAKAPFQLTLSTQPGNWTTAVESYASTLGDEGAKGLARYLDLNCADYIVVDVTELSGKIEMGLTVRTSVRGYPKSRPADDFALAIGLPILIIGLALSTVSLAMSHLRRRG